MIEYIFNNIIFNISILQGHVTYRIFFYVSQWNLKEKKYSEEIISKIFRRNSVESHVYFINYY